MTTMCVALGGSAFQAAMSPPTSAARTLWPRVTMGGVAGLTQTPSRLRGARPNQLTTP
jgi:hypothetical protein